MNENVEKDEKSPIPNKYITCPHCGEQIPMMPALSQMIETIENHLSTHKNHVGYLNHDPIRHPRVPSIREDLAEQVLIRAAEIGDSLSKEPTITINPAT